MESKQVVAHLLFCDEHKHGGIIAKVTPRLTYDQREELRRRSNRENAIIAFPGRDAPSSAITLSFREEFKVDSRQLDEIIGRVFKDYSVKRKYYNLHEPDLPELIFDLMSEDLLRGH